MMRGPILTAVLLGTLLCSCRNREDPAATAEPEAARTAYDHTVKLLSFGPRPPQSAGLRKCREYIRSVLEPAGWVVTTQSARARTPAGEITFINVLARYDTGDEDTWQRPVDGLVAAHLDSKLMRPPNNFLGADDAASAVGAILSLATRLTPDEAARLELVFFDGEEAIGQDMGMRPDGLFDGLYGSRAYMQRWTRAARKPSWGLVLDMIGHHDLAISLPSDSPPVLARRLLAAAEAEGAGDAFRMGESEILDDHVPLNAAGIPTIDMIGNFQRFKWWHTDRDDLSNISPESLALSEAVATRFIRDLLANPPDRETSEATPQGSEP